MTASQDAWPQRRSWIISSIGDGRLPRPANHDHGGHVRWCYQHPVLQLNAALSSS